MSAKPSFPHVVIRASAGTDEVGRGCLAGPVVAACVILDTEPTLVGVNDSKLVDHEDRIATQARKRLGEGFENSQLVVQGREGAHRQHHRRRL